MLIRRVGTLRVVYQRLLDPLLRRPPLESAPCQKDDREARSPVPLADRDFARRSGNMNWATEARDLARQSRSTDSVAHLMFP